MELIGTALDRVRDKVFSIAFVTHDKKRQKGGEIRQYPEVMILNEDNINTLKAKSGKTQNTVQWAEIPSGEVTKRKRKVERNYLNILVLVAGLPTGKPPIKIFIPLILNIDGQKLMI